MASRKRAASASPQPDNDLVMQDGIDQGNSTAGKRKRRFDELDMLSLSPPDSTFQFDRSSLLNPGNPMPPPREGNSASGNNLANYNPSTSIFVLCILGYDDLQYNFLLEALPTLYAISPSLQAVVMKAGLRPTGGGHSQSPSRHIPVVLEDRQGRNPFLKLGLLDPMGGGYTALDTIAVIDPHGRRRLVLPFGWGPGKYVFDEDAWEMVQEQMTGTLVRAVQELEWEVQHETGP